MKSLDDEESRSRHDWYIIATLLGLAISELHDRGLVTHQERIEATAAMSELMVVKGIATRDEIDEAIKG